MKIIIATIISLVVSLQVVVGFTVPMSVLQTSSVSTTGSIRNVMSTIPLRSSPADENNEEEGLDLNLEEMFTMFDAADKGVDFDKAIDQVKSEK